MQTSRATGTSPHPVYRTVVKADAVQYHLLIDGQIDAFCSGTFDELFAPQILSPPMSDVSPTQVPYGFTVEDNMSPGGSRETPASYPMSFSPVGSEDMITGYFVPGNSPDHFNGSEVSPPYQRRPSGCTSGSISGPRLILPSSPSGLSPAQLVDCLRNSPYVMEHCLEPTNHQRRSIFLELLRKTPNLQHHFECIVPLSDGTPCGKPFNRSDRGLTHVRTHFDYRPFYCGGQCGNQNW